MCTNYPHYLNHLWFEFLKAVQNGGHPSNHEQPLCGFVARGKKKEGKKKETGNAKWKLQLRLLENINYPLLSKRARPSQPVWHWVPPHTPSAAPNLDLHTKQDIGSTI